MVKPAKQANSCRKLWPMDEAKANTFLVLITSFMRQKSPNYHFLDIPGEPHRNNGRSHLCLLNKTFNLYGNIFQKKKCIYIHNNNKN